MEFPKLESGATGMIEHRQRPRAMAHAAIIVYPMATYTTVMGAVYMCDLSFVPVL
jgi:hypothetical protein